ncbi:MAG: Gfo/Idh/MocA family oxidoreductase [Gemmatimonadales bacterium]
MTKLRTIAVIGCGEAGYEIHLPALALMPGISTVGACDPDSVRAERVSKKFGVRVYSTVQELLGATKPEVVIVATPPDLHTSVCLDAIAAGCHVICEKPFVPVAEEGRRIIAAADAAGTRIALNHEFREMPIFRALLDATRSDNKAKVFFAQLWQNTYVPPWTEGGWRGAMKRRTLHEAGVHLIDYIIALFGEMPEAVWASMSAGGQSDGGSDALTVVSLEFSGGRMAQVVQNRLCKGETQYFEIRADTNEASYRASFGGRARITTGLHRSTRPHLRIDYGASGMAWVERGNKRKLLARNPADPRVVSTRRVLELSLKAFEDGSRASATAEDGLDALRVIDACYSAAHTGMRTTVSG